MSSVWVVSGISNVPSDPAAETMPSTLLLRCSGIARAVAVNASDEAVHDSATPINTPDAISAGAPPAAAMTASPMT